MRRRGSPKYESSRVTSVYSHNDKHDAVSGFSVQGHDSAFFAEQESGCTEGRDAHPTVERYTAQRIPVTETVQPATRAAYRQARCRQGPHRRWRARNLQGAKFYVRALCAFWNILLEMRTPAVPALSNMREHFWRQQSCRNVTCCCRERHCIS